MKSALYVVETEKLTQRYTGTIALSVKETSEMPRWTVESMDWHLQVGKYSCRIWRYEEPGKFYWKVGQRPGGWRKSGHARSLRGAKLKVEAAVNRLTISKPKGRK